MFMYMASVFKTVEKVKSSRTQLKSNLNSNNKLKLTIIAKLTY